jgi:hypothetical protein
MPSALFPQVILFYFIWWCRGLNSGLHACQAGTLMLVTPLIHFALVILQMEFQELFAWVGLEL